MTADIIQFIQRPKSDQEQTDFPTIAFRSAVPDLAKGDLAKGDLETAPCEYVVLEGGET